MTGSPRVAVIVPCYNDGATVEQTVASVLSEPEEFELIVVDDGSDDAETLAAFTRLEQQGVQVLHQKNGGLSSARMAGVAATVASYVFPLDADDELLEGGLSRLADTLDAEPELGLAWGDVLTFGDEELLVEALPHLCPWLITHMDGIPVSSLLRRSALARTPGWRFRRELEDWDLWMSFAEQGSRGRRVPGPVLHYRVRSGRMYARAVLVYDERLAELKAHHPDLYRARGRNWRRSRMPLLARLLVPLASRLPVSGLRRTELVGSVVHVGLGRLDWQRVVRRLLRRQPERSATKA